MKFGIRSWNSFQAYRIRLSSIKLPNAIRITELPSILHTVSLKHSHFDGFAGIEFYVLYITYSAHCCRLLAPSVAVLVACTHTTNSCLFLSAHLFTSIDSWGSIICFWRWRMCLLCAQCIEWYISFSQSWFRCSFYLFFAFVATAAVGPQTILPMNRAVRYCGYNFSFIFLTLFYL